MKSFKSYLNEEKFTNWVKPSSKDIKHEYDIEYVMKGLSHMTDDAWPRFEDFKKAVNSAKVLKVTPSIDRKIAYRSHTRSKEQLLNLIKGYASYPQYRNEKTIQAIYDGFENNSPMKMPLVLKFQNGDMRVLGGNTRMDVARHMGIDPKVLLVEV